MHTQPFYSSATNLVTVGLLVEARLESTVSVDELIIRSVPGRDADCQKRMSMAYLPCSLSTTANSGLPHRRSHASKKLFASQSYPVPKALVLSWSTITHVFRSNACLCHQFWRQRPREDYYSGKPQSKLASL